jgi:hypothetical protein
VLGVVVEVVPLTLPGAVELLVPVLLWPAVEPMPFWLMPVEVALGFVVVDCPTVLPGVVPAVVPVLAPV